MEFSYPVPKQDEVVGEFSNKWLYFVSHFLNHQDQDGTSKVSFLLHFGANAIQEIVEIHQLSSEELNRFSSFVEVLEDKCLFQVAITFLRYLFFNHCCKSGSRLEDFYTELKLLSEMCSFDSVAADNFIKNHVIYSFQEERVRDVLVNNSANLTANDVVDVCSKVETHPGASTPELFESYLFLKNQQKILLQNSIKMRKDFGVSVFQHKRTKMTKSSTLTVISRNDSRYNIDEVEKSDNGEKLSSYSSANLTRMDSQSDVTPNTPNEIDSLEVSFSHPVEGTSNRTSSPPVTSIGPTCQDSTVTYSLSPSVPLPLPGIIFQKEESSKAKKKKGFEQNMTVTAGPVISSTSSVVSTIASTINTATSSSLTSDISIPGTTTAPAAGIRCDPNFSVKESTLRKAPLDSNTKANDSKKDDANNKTVNCQVCSISFSKERLLSDHMVSMHPDVNTINRWICHICRTGFSTKILLKNHVAEIHKNGQDTIRCLTCNKCGLNFRDRKSLITHKKKNHWKRKELRFSCECCDYVCISNAALVYHRRIHTGEKPFMCEICGRNFSALSSLEKHQRTHTGEKPFKCQYCGHAFAGAENRTAHERVHRKERPYICDQCARAFRNSYELKTHIKFQHEASETGIKPFKCEVCGYHFTCPASLKRHRNTTACLKKLSK